MAPVLSLCSLQPAYFASQKEVSLQAVIFLKSIGPCTILLATGKELLPVFHGPGFFPLYVVTADIEAQALFEVGANSLLYALEPLQVLPFTDFAADMVVLDVGSFPKHLLRGVVTEAVRILAQQGVLFVLGATEFDISRRLGVVPGVPICKGCGMRPMFGERSIELSPKNQCQAWVQPGFNSIFGPEIASRFSPNKSVENQRLKWPKTLASAKCHKNSAGTL